VPAAGIPPGAQFAIEPRQAWAMIAQAIAAGGPFGWFTADGPTAGQSLQAWPEEQDASYAMAAWAAVRQI
jgi:hypothetical protein